MMTNSQIFSYFFNKTVHPLVFIDASIYSKSYLLAYSLFQQQCIVFIKEIKLKKSTAVFFY